MKKYAILFIMAGLCGSASAAVLTSGTFVPEAGLFAGATNDVFQNAVTITADSGMHPVGYLAEDMFNAGSAVFNDDSIFQDDAIPTSFIEFNTAGSITLTNMNILIGNDGFSTYIRAASHVKVYARTSAGTFAVGDLVADIAVDPDHISAYGSQKVTLELDFGSVITAQYFRVEVEEIDFGARLNEIDGNLDRSAVITRASFTPTDGLFQNGSTSDVFQNAVTVTADSGLHIATPNAMDMFNSGSPILGESVIFTDDAPTTAFVEFNTASAFDLSNMDVIFASDGGTNFGRSVSHAKVYARTTAGTFGAGDLIADIEINPDFNATYGANTMAMELDFRVPVNAQYFRVEVEEVSGGARIVEIDGNLERNVVLHGKFSLPAPPMLGATDDMFENATVISHSPIIEWLAFDINDLFNSTNYNFSSDIVYEAFFRSGSEFVEFSIANSIVLRNVTVTLASDGNPTFDRALINVQVYASSSAGIVAEDLIADVEVDPNYPAAFGSNTIQLSIDLPGINAQYFRLSFQANSISNGLRVVEIDGYEGGIVDPATIISFASVSSNVVRMVVDTPNALVRYSPQSKSDLVIGAWVDVAHSDNALTGFALTNLSHSSSEGTNAVIYVQANDPAEFFKIIGE